MDPMELDPVCPVSVCLRLCVCRWGSPMAARTVGGQDLDLAGAVDVVCALQSSRHEDSGASLGSDDGLSLASAAGPPSVCPPALVATVVHHQQPPSALPCAPLHTGGHWRLARAGATHCGGGARHQRAHRSPGPAGRPARDCRPRRVPGARARMAPARPLGTRQQGHPGC